MEQRQGEKHAVRTLLRRGLAVSPRSRYTHLALALWEKEEGDLQEARRVFRQGSRLNPRDAAILQVRWAGWVGGSDWDVLALQACTRLAWAAEVLPGAGGPGLHVWVVAFRGGWVGAGTAARLLW